MPTIIAQGDTPCDTGFDLSPAKAGDSRAAVTTALRRGYRNCNALRLLLAVVACASLILVWTASSTARQNRAAECEPVPSRSVEEVGSDGSSGGDGDGRPRKVAVCFFGVARSLRWTLPSVQNRVLNVLTDAGMEVETFVHTYVMREVRIGRQRCRDAETKLAVYSSTNLLLSCELGRAAAAACVHLS